MDSTIQQQIEARIAELPPDVQAAIASSDFDDKIRAITQANNLHIDQSEHVADQAMMAMLGFIDMEDLAHSLEKSAQLPAAQAQTIANAIAHDIFMPIRESMKAWAAAKRGATPETAPQPGPSVVMPSSMQPSQPAPVAAPAAAPTPAPAPIPTPAAAPKGPVTDLTAVDATLSQKQVTPPPPPAASAPAEDAGKPQQYKADPYREPIE